MGEDQTHSKRDRVSCREENGPSKGEKKIKTLQAKDQQQTSSYSGRRMVPAKERTGSRPVPSRRSMRKSVGRKESPAKDHLQGG